MKILCCKHVREQLWQANATVAGETKNSWNRSRMTGQLWTRKLHCSKKGLCVIVSIVRVAMHGIYMHCCDITYLECPLHVGLLRSCTYAFIADMVYHIFALKISRVGYTLVIKIKGSALD